MSTDKTKTQLKNKLKEIIAKKRKETQETTRPFTEDLDGKKVWAVHYEYAKNNAMTIIFLTEDGELRRLLVKSVFPYFYVDGKQYTSYDVKSIIEREDKARHVKDVYMEKKNDPFTDEERPMVKVVVRAPYNVWSSNMDSNVSISFPEESVYNNHVRYNHVVFNELDIIMGMPYLVQYKNGEKHAKIASLRPVYKVDWANHQDGEIRSLVRRFGTNNRMLTIATEAMNMLHAEKPNIEKLTMAIDIEIKVNFAESMNPEKTQAPVSSIAMTTSEGTKVIVLSNKTLGHQSKQKQETFDDGTFEKIIVDSEALLLRLFIEEVEKSGKQILVTYNGDGFDFLYLHHRMRLFGIAPPIKIVRDYQGKVDTATWEGKIHIDLYKHFKNPSVKTYAYGNKYENMKLDTVAEALIGQKKYAYEGQISEMSSEELAFYNAKDTQITYALFVHDKAYPAYIIFFISRFGNLSLEEASRKGVTHWWNGYLFRLLHHLNYYYPNDQQLRKDGGRITGGFVFPAKSGIYRDVQVWDAPSLYPTIMKTRNIGFSTMQCKHEECKQKYYEIKGEKIWACEKRRGFIPDAVGFFREARVNIYKKRGKTDQYYHNMAQFLKVVMNSCYGVLDNPGFKFSDKRASASIAYMGRQIITRFAQAIEEMGGTIIYGDSVLHDQCVAVKNKEEQEYELIPVQELWEKMAEHSPITHTEDGKEIIETEGVEAWDGNEWTTLKGIVRHQARKATYHVSNGHVGVSVTEDHSLILPTGEMARPAEISEDTPLNNAMPFFPLVETGEKNNENYNYMYVFKHLFSQYGTISWGVTTDKPNMHLELSIDKAEVLKPLIEKLLDEMIEKDLFMGAKYKTYFLKGKKGRRKARYRFKITHFKELAEYIDKELYPEGYKIKPYTKIEPVSFADLRLLYFIYWASKKVGDTKKGSKPLLMFNTQKEALFFTMVMNQLEQPFVSFYDPLRRKYYVIIGAQPDGKTRVVSRRTLQPVYDLTTMNGVFMAGGTTVKNTDSVFIGGDITEEQIRKASEKSMIDMEKEGSWDILLQYAKKNYLLKSKNGLQKIKGMVGKKKNVPKIIKKAFKEAIDIIDPSKTNDEMLEDVMCVLKKYTKKIMTLDFSIDDIKTTQSLSKDIDQYKSNTPLVTAARNMMKELKGSETEAFGKEGVVVEYVKVRTSQRWKHVNTVSKAEIDVDHYVNMLYSIFSQLLVPFGTTVVDSKENVNGQKKISDFF